jgi:predicted DNA-binding transcriptional regulator AlpA
MKWLRFPDLVEKGVVQSKQTLQRLIDKEGFPPGVMITPNARSWSEDDIDNWILARPTARKTDYSRKNRAA